MQQNSKDAYHDHLSRWVTERTESWKKHRDNNHKSRWDQYYRLWKGVHTQEDKTYESERSQLIAPALTQAIEAAVAEVEEAVFGSKWWFDIENNYGDDPNPFYDIRNMLKEDLEMSNVPDSISEIILNAAIYGTGIGKVRVEENPRAKVVAKGNSLMGFEAGVDQFDKFCVKLDPVHPKDFIPDPAGRSITEMMGCAHDLMVPTYIVKEKQAKGIYRKTDIGVFDGKFDTAEMAEQSPDRPADFTRLLEWHGLVPRDMLNDTHISDTEYQQLTDAVDHNEYEDMVEAIVTIANEEVCIKKIENPFLMKDRSIVAFTWDRVPNRFWGRGIAEKGFNPQKALDAELRGRIDAMALQIRPMLASDGSKLPRGFRLDVKAGRHISMSGDPTNAFAKLDFGDVSPHTFHQSGELERMVQMGTGSMDSATPTSINPRNQTASGMSMIQSGFIKRSKRTVKNFSENFLVPFIEKAMWRYQQYVPDKYPPVDLKFRAKSSLGIMAREFESAQLTQLLQTTEPNSLGWWMLIKGIYQHSSIEDKDEMVQFAEQMLKQVQNPKPDPVVEKAKQLELMDKEADIEKKKSETVENYANAKSMASNSGEQTDDPAKRQLEIFKINKDSETKTKIALIDAKSDENVANIKARADVIKMQLPDNKSEEKSEKCESDGKSGLNLVLNDAIINEAKRPEPKPKVKVIEGKTSDGRAFSAKIKES